MTDFKKKVYSKLLFKNTQMLYLNGPRKVAKIVMHVSITAANFVSFNWTNIVAKLTGLTGKSSEPLTTQ